MCLIKLEAMKSYWSIRGIASHILTFGTKWRWEVKFDAPAALFRGE